MARPSNRDKERLRKKARKEYEEKKPERIYEDRSLREQASTILWDIEQGQMPKGKTGHAAEILRQRLEEIEASNIKHLFAVEAQQIRHAMGRL